MASNANRESVRNRRLQAGLTQADVALRAKISRSKYAFYEQGYVELTGEELRRVGKVVRSVKPKPPSTPLGQYARIMGVAAPDASSGNEPEAASPFSTMPPHLRNKPMKDMSLQERHEVLRHYLQARRRESGISQHELARALKITQTRLSQWESGKLVPSNEQLQQWEDSLLDRRIAKKLSDPFFLLDKQTDENDTLREENRLLREELQRKQVAVEQLVAVQEKMVAAQKMELRIDDEIIATYRELVEQLKGAAQDKEQKIAAMEQRVALLSDLLNVRTKESLAGAEAQELGVKLRAHDGPETEQE